MRAAQWPNACGTSVENLNRTIIAMNMFHMHTWTVHKYTYARYTCGCTYTWRAAYRGGMSWKERNHTLTYVHPRHFVWILCAYLCECVRVLVCRNWKSAFFGVSGLFAVLLFLSSAHTDVHTILCVLCHCTNYDYEDDDYEVAIYTTTATTTTMRRPVQQRLQLWICCAVKCACLYYRSHHETTKLSTIKLQNGLVCERQKCNGHSMRMKWERNTAPTTTLEK